MTMRSSGAAWTFIVANPLISRSKPSFAAPHWLAIQVGVGPKRALVSWTAGTGNYNDVQGAPAAYRIESSADSSNGSDGNWRVEVSVTGNAVRTRAHSFEFDGQSWVRLTIIGAHEGSPTARIDQVDVHDASDGTDDTWFCLGDDPTAFAVGRDTPSAQPSFAEHIYARYPGYFPAMINGGIGGEVSADGLARIRSVLDQNPDVRFFAIGYGANDVRANPLNPAQFRANLAALIAEVVAAGRVPVLARISFSPDLPHASLDAYNAVIDELTAENGLLPGPDLHAWADAMDALYVPQ